MVLGKKRASYRWIVLAIVAALLSTWVILDWHSLSIPAPWEPVTLTNGENFELSDYGPEA